MSGTDPTSEPDRPPPPPAGGAVPPPGPLPPLPGPPPATGLGTAPESADPFFQRLFDVSFSRFVTPSIIKLLFIVAIATASVFALFMLAAGFATIDEGGILLVLLAPLCWLLAVIYARVFLELVIILLRIESNTRR
jgi:Domain of unknown function (DUF4282)